MSDPPSPDDWIVIPNWEKFQHYKNRNPLWIKVYSNLLNKDEWLALSDTQRGLLVNIWLLYAATDGQLRVRHTREIGRGNVRLKSLRSLNHAGFIRFRASKPLAQRQRHKKPLKKKEKNPAENGPEPLTGDVQSFLKNLQRRAK